MPDTLHVLGGIAVMALIFALYGVGLLPDMRHPLAP